MRTASLRTARTLQHRSSPHFEALEDRRLLAADLSGVFAGRLPTSVPPTGLTYLHFELQDVGSATAKGAATVTLYASNTPTYTSGDLQIGTAQTRNIALPARRFVPMLFRLTDPATLADGSYYVVAVITTTIVEDSTTNNTVPTTSTIAFHQPFVDLSDSATNLTRRTISAGVRGKDLATANVKITNSGNVTARGKLTIEVDGSDAPGAGAGTVVLWTPPARFVAIPAGRSVVLNLTGLVPATTPTGTFYLAVKLQFAGTVADTGSGNRFTSSSTPITITNSAVSPAASLAGSLSAGTTTVATGATTPVFFSINVTNADAATVIDVDQVDSSGNDLGTVGTLTDAGANGDAHAGDGVFSGNVSLTFSSAAPLYFIAKLGEAGVATTSISANTVTITGVTPLTISSNVLEVVVGHPETVRFSIPTVGATANTAVEIDEVTSTGTFVGLLDNAYDDGSPAHADAVADDGIYSGINTIAFNAPGTRYFQAKMTTGGTVRTGPILAIPGVAAPSSMQLGADSSDAAAISQTAKNILASGGTNAAALAAVATALSTDSNVRPGSIKSDATSVVWTTTDGVFQGVDTNFLTGGDTLAAPPPAAATPAAPAQVTADDSSSGSNGSVLILSPFAASLSAYDPSAAIDSAFADANYSVTYHTDAAVTLNDFTNLGQYDAIDLYGHGCTLPGSGEGFYTSITDSVTNLVLNAWDLLNGRLADMNGYLVVTPSYITTYSGEMDGTIVIANCCDSAYDATMADAFTNNGAAAYLGYTQVVKAGFAAGKAQDAWNTLLQSDNNTVDDIPGLFTDHDANTPPAYFVAYGDLSATLPMGQLLKSNQLYVQYNWPQDVSDLDSNTTFLGASVGYNLGGSTYLHWSGDNTGSGGTETTTVDLYDSWLAGAWSGSTTVGVGADWYTPAGGSGPAVITVALQNIQTGKLTHVVTESVSPGQETEGAQTRVATVSITLSGGVNNPTVKITVM
jgi:hypothetical protein